MTDTAEDTPTKSKETTQTDRINIPAQNILVPDQDLQVTVTAVPKGEGNLPTPPSGNGDPPPPFVPTPLPPPAIPAPPPLPAAPSVVIISPQEYMQRLLDDARHANEAARGGMQAKFEADIAGLNAVLLERDKNRDALDAKDQQAIRVQSETNQREINAALASMLIRLDILNGHREQIDKLVITFMTKEGFAAAMEASNKLMDERFSAMSARIERDAQEMRQATERVDLANVRRLEPINDKLGELKDKRIATEGGTASILKLISVIAIVVGILATIINLAPHFIR